MLRRSLTHAFTATALLFTVPACADANMVVMKNFDYSPMALSVPVGATVTWKNLDGEPHTVVSVDGAFRSAALDQNDTYSFTFKKAGTFKYVCSIHPKMMASITVK
jgi:plastocyanin